MKHLFEHLISSADTALSVGGVLPVADGIQGALEADLIERRTFLPGTLKHETADKVVGDGVEKEFAADHVRGEAAHGGGVHGGFDVIEIELHFPTPHVEGDKSFHWPKSRVEEGGDEEKLLGTKARHINASADLANGDGFWQALPESWTHHTTGNPRTLHGDDAVVLSKALTFVPVHFIGIASAHHQIDSAHGQESKVGKGPKAAISDDDIPPPQNPAQEGKEARFAGFPFAVCGMKQGSAAQAKDAQKINERPTTSRLLRIGLRPFLLKINSEFQERARMDGAMSLPTYDQTGRELKQVPLRLKINASFLPNFGDRWALGIKYRVRPCKM